MDRSCVFFFQNPLVSDDGEEEDAEESGKYYGWVNIDLRN